MKIHINYVSIFNEEREAITNEIKMVMGTDP